MKSHTTKTITLLVLLLLMLVFPVLASEPSPTPEENQAPAVEDLELTTYRGVDVSGTLIALDPEGDLLEFQVVRSPRKGTLELDPPTGRFIYTPNENARGRDSFTYVAVDALGNISPEATVRLRIERQSSQVSYADMAGHPAHFAAVTLAERDVFVGERIGERHFFNPATPVRRGDFLAASMRLAGTELLSGVSRTGFSDDDAIADWLKPYVSTAVLDGVVRGMRSDYHDLIFAPDHYITANEAAVILSNVLGLSDAPVSAQLNAAFTVPPWAQQATANLTVRNILPPTLPGALQYTMTRADVAEMLLGAIHVLEGRTMPSPSLLGWAI